MEVLSTADLKKQIFPAYKTNSSAVFYGARNFSPTTCDGTGTHVYISKEEVRCSGHSRNYVFHLSHYRNVSRYFNLIINILCKFHKVCIKLSQDIFWNLPIHQPHQRWLQKVVHFAKLAFCRIKQHEFSIILDTIYQENLFQPKFQQTKKCHHYQMFAAIPKIIFQWR